MRDTAWDQKDRDTAAMAILDLEEVRALPTLEHVSRFSVTQVPSWRLADVVIQDEYTHDVVFAVDQQTVLVFDTT